MTTKKAGSKRGKKRERVGPKPDILQIDMDVRSAVRKAMKKKKPAEGWPKEEK